MSAYGEEICSDIHPDFPISTVKVADVWVETLGISQEVDGHRSRRYESLTSMLQLVDLCGQASKRCEAMNSEDLARFGKRLVPSS